MKEATGELSTTVIAVVAIAAVLTIFTTILLPYLKSSIMSSMHCSDSYGCVCPEDGKSKCTCYYDDPDTGETSEIKCTNPNEAE